MAEDGIWECIDELNNDAEDQHNEQGESLADKK
jgi:hypothetical protein